MREAPGRQGAIVMFLADVDTAIGGTERQARLLAAELDARGFRVIIVTRARPRAIRDRGASRTANVPIVRLRTMRRLPSWSFLVSFLVWGARHRREIDVSHAHSTSLGVIASIAGRLLGKPVVAKVTGMKHAHALGSPAPLRRLRRWALARHARLIALTREMQGVLLSEAGVRADAVEVVPNGVAVAPAVDDGRRAALRAEWLGDDVHAVVLFVGRLKEGKGVDRLLRVWAAMPPPPGAMLVLVGDGPLEASLAATAGRLGLGRSVRFLGLQHDVTPFYAIADVFVLPSTTEGMSNALLEALAAGVTPVASDIPANREVVETGSSGFLVDWTDIPGTAGLLSRLLSDAALRVTIGRGARERAASFSIDHIAERYSRLYRSLTEPRVSA